MRDFKEAMNKVEDNYRGLVLKYVPIEVLYSDAPVKEKIKHAEEFSKYYEKAIKGGK